MSIITLIFFPFLIRDLVSYHITISHDTSTSTAEPINLQARLSLPPYVVFSILDVQNADPSFPVPNDTVGDDGITLSVIMIDYWDL